MIDWLVKDEVGKAKNEFTAVALQNRHSQQRRRLVMHVRRHTLSIQKVKPRNTMLHLPGRPLLE